MSDHDIIGAGMPRDGAEKSCVGCKFLCGAGSGYSNYTWMETYVKCALELNPALEEDHEQPEGFARHPTLDEWPPTKDGRCDRYAPGQYWTADPDREDRPADDLNDAEQIAALTKFFRLEDQT